MERAWVIRGRLAGPKHIELDEPLDQAAGAVEVVVRFPPTTPSARESVFDLIARLGDGTRSKEEIDAALQADRAGWGDR